MAPLMAKKGLTHGVGAFFWWLGELGKPRELLMYIRNLCVLFLFVSVSAFAVPPYAGTVFVNENTLTSADPSTFVKVEAAGKGRREQRQQPAYPFRHYGLSWQMAGRNAVP
ncbi:hypothetical protein E3V39_00090 [Gammaproteobacteria bacterium LSUCC0112]|nr:hypothetical protein E3V39_00090 [Gammaproteobacteria bacterium LSUCC0112]